MGARVIAVARGAEKRAVAAAAGAGLTLDAERDIRAEVRRSAAPTWSTTRRRRRCSTPRCARRGPARGCCRSASPAATVPQIPANRLLVKNLTVIGLYFGAWVRRASGRGARQPRDALRLVRAGAPAPARQPRPAARGGERRRSTCCASRRATGKVVVRVAGATPPPSARRSRRPGACSAPAASANAARGPSPTYMLIR